MSGLPEEDLEELREGTVLRQAKRRAAFTPTSEPLASDFSLDGKDADEADLQNRPAMLSVFDQARTTLDQLREITKNSESPIYELDIGSICSLSKGLPPEAPAVRVLRDLLLPEKMRTLPGADGHCGIEGLRRPKNLAGSKKIYSALRDQLRLLASLARSDVE